MVNINNFAIHITYTCPLACAHCCFGSSPKNKDRLPISYILESIRALGGSGIKMIALTGGEPFLLGTKLKDVVAEAAKLRVSVRIVTSAHWATSDGITKKWLAELQVVGLSELSISWDDFHEEFVSFENIRRTYLAAKELGLTVAISLVQGATSKWTATRVRQKLGLPKQSDDIIVESPLNLTGRADEELHDAGLRSERYIGPCPYVITGPTLSAKRKLLACCGVIPHTEELVIDSSPTPETINTSIERSRRSVLLNWLHLRGPYAIMEYIGKTYGEAIPLKTSLGGNCEACKVLFESPNISRHIPRAVSEKTDQISGELELLSSLEMLDSAGIMALWSKGATVTDVATYQESTNVV